MTDLDVRPDGLGHLHLLEANRRVVEHGLRLLLVLHQPTDVRLGSPDPDLGRLITTTSPQGS